MRALRGLRCAVVGAAVSVFVVGACGRSVDEDLSAAVPPAKVAAELVPPTLNSGSFTVAEDETGRAAFASVGTDSLIADGRVFTIRDQGGERLVGVLQLSTVEHRVDLTDAKQRQTMLNQIIPGSKERVRIGSVEATLAAGEDKTVYVWFSRDHFQVLQLKPTKASPFDPEAVLSELIAYQVGQVGWKPLPRPERTGEAPS